MDLYDAYRNGTELLARGDFHAAAIPLGQVREQAPEKASVREAYGRALFGAQRYREAAEEFEALVQRAPTDHHALFCLGRCMQKIGKHAEARAPLAQACLLAPGRKDYARYRDEAVRRAA